MGPAGASCRREGWQVQIDLGPLRYGASRQQPELMIAMAYEGKEWSEWQDLNLRPLRPERSCSTTIQALTGRAREHAFAARACFVHESTSREVHMNLGALRMGS